MQMKPGKLVLVMVLAVFGLGMTACQSSGPSLTGFFSDGSVRVTSVPSGASIYVDEGVDPDYDGSSFRHKTRYGHTPQSVSLTAGDHLFRISKRGFKDYEEWVNVPAGGVTELHVILEPLEGSVEE